MIDLEAIDRLKTAAWLDRMHAEAPYSGGDSDVVAGYDPNDVLALIKEHKRLREALERYGHHDQGCPTIVTLSLCNCGLAQALEQESA